MLPLIDPQNFAKISEILFDQKDLLFRMLGKLRYDNRNLATISNVVPGPAQLSDRNVMVRGTKAQQLLIGALRAMDKFDYDKEACSLASPRTILMQPLAIVHQRFIDNVLQLKKVVSDK